MEASTAPRAILAVSRRGAELARRIQAGLAADLILPERLVAPSVPAELDEQTSLSEAMDRREPSALAPPVTRTGTGGGATRSYGVEGVRAAVADAFARYEGLVLILPVGAAVRLIAPLIRDKDTDPGVVALDEAGAYAVALLSGHVGGGNELARAVAATVGARPVITTAAEVLENLALDLLGRAWGWTIEDAVNASTGFSADSNRSGAALTRASAALLDGEPVGACQDAGEESWWLGAPSNLRRYASLADLAAAPVAARLVISDRRLPMPLPPPVVIYRPRTLVVGVGCVRGATAEEIAALLEETLARHGLALASVRALATVDRKQDEAGILNLAQRHGWELRTFTGAELTAAGAPSGVSAAVEQAVGAPGVCEPAALLAAGATTLVVPKTRTRRVTIAVARITPHRGTMRRELAPDPARVPGTHPDVSAAQPLHEDRGGSLIDGGGSLALVGIGPGGPAGITARAREVLEGADAVIGYDGYLEQLRPWLVGPALHGSPIGEEVQRARLAIALARAGQRVALVSSGDAGVYGTAGIVFELLHDADAGAEAAAVEVVPGVSAAHAAAALLGAPLMNDYAAISLSDLMTPWEVIERRLEAVAAADLVVALYNPASGRRRAQLARAQELLLRHRPSETPVGLVRNAGRAGQAIRIVALGELLEQEIDMLTIVIVGNRATIRVGDRLVTRRGYLDRGHSSERDERGER